MVTFFCSAVIFGVIAAIVVAVAVAKSTEEEE